MKALSVLGQRSSLMAVFIGFIFFCLYFKSKFVIEVQREMSDEHRLMTVILPKEKIENEWTHNSSRRSSNNNNNNTNKQKQQQQQQQRHKLNELPVIR